LPSPIAIEYKLYRVIGLANTNLPMC
jgi:hypothetical protein